MKLFAVAVVLCIVVFAETNAYSHKQETLAKFGVEMQGPGFNFIKLKKARTQVVAGTMHHMTVKVKRQMPGAPSGAVDCNLKVWEKLDGCIHIESFSC